MLAPTPEGTTSRALRGKSRTTAIWGLVRLVRSRRRTRSCDGSGFVNAHCQTTIKYPRHADDGSHSIHDLTEEEVGAVDVLERPVNVLVRLWVERRELRAVVLGGSVCRICGEPKRELAWRGCCAPREGEEGQLRRRLCPVSHCLTKHVFCQGMACAADGDLP